MLIHALSMGCSRLQTAVVLPLAGQKYLALFKERRVTSRLMM